MANNDKHTLAGEMPGNVVFGIQGESAYQVAVRNGFEGTEEEWLKSLSGPAGVSITDMYDLTASQSAAGTQSLAGKRHTLTVNLSDGTVRSFPFKDGDNGQRGRGVYPWDLNASSSFVDDEGITHYRDGVTLPDGVVLLDGDLLLTGTGDVYRVEQWNNIYGMTVKHLYNIAGSAPDSGGNAENGEDGFSPIATVTQTEAGAVISITDANGTTTATITNGKNGTDGAKGDKGDKGDPGDKGETGAQGIQGEKGEQGEQGIQGIPGEKGDKGDKGDAGTQGEPGKDGANGKDGTSVTHSWNGTTLTVTSASGTSSADLKGAKGDKGDKGDSIKGDTGVDGVSPTVDVSKSGKVTTISITDKNGTKTATINDGADGEDGKDATAADAVPAYWQTAIDEGVEAINTALFAAGRNKSAFLFYSDAHWSYGSQMAPTLLKYLYNHTGMTKTFFGGDIVNNEADDYDTMKYLWNWRNQLKGLPNHHSVVGNHDDGNSTNNLFSEQYVYGYLLSAEETPDMVVGDNGLYYYIDNPAEKTRYLCLDTAYKGVDSDQTTFITEALKTTPANWHIVVVAHIWFQPDYTQSSVRPIPITGLDSGASTVATLLDSYNARSGDFADCAAWVEFCIGGHVHIDYDGQTPGGIPIILVETDSQHIRSTLSYTAGTTTESSVNGIVADYDNGKIHVVRIGRGESREITVSDTVVSYTNVLPLSLAADGASVYNADGTPGYKANTRWSQSSQADQDSDGQYITGWIPLKQYDVLRFKNMTMGSDIAILYANAPGSTAGSVGYDTAMSWNGISDDSGNLVQFEWMNTQPYIRIQCTYIDPDSIITINEPID